MLRRGPGRTKHKQQHCKRQKVACCGRNRVVFWFVLFFSRECACVCPFFIGIHTALRVSVRCMVYFSFPFCCWSFFIVGFCCLIIVQTLPTNKTKWRSASRRHRGTANRKAAKIKTETTSSIQDTHSQICAQRVGTERVIDIVRVIIKNVRKWQQLKFFSLAQTL